MNEHTRIANALKEASANIHEIHTPHGFGYAVCENCYNIEREIEKRWRNK